MSIREISEFVEASSPQDSDKLLIERNGSGKSITVKNLFDEFYNIPRRVPKDITPYWADGTLWNRIAGTGGYKFYDDIHVGDYIDMGRPALSWLKPNLTEYYIGVKISMGVSTKEEHADRITYTETLREKIRELENKLAM